MSAFQFTQPCYTIAQVEHMLCISRSTVNRRIKEGVFKKFQLGANSVRITADSLEAFLNNRMMGSQMGSYA
jgi:predicted DNA-binding transcriptional regulator AlpA